MWLPIACRLRELCFAGDRQSSTWDFGRFVKTVTYFNEPPSAEQVLQALVEQPAKLVRQLTGQDEVRLFVYTHLFCIQHTLLAASTPYISFLDFCVYRKSRVLYSSCWQQTEHRLRPPVTMWLLWQVKGDLHSCLCSLPHFQLKLTVEGDSNGASCGLISK